MHELIEILQRRKIHFNIDLEGEEIDSISLDYETQEDFVHIGVSAIELGSWADAMAAWGIASTEGINTQVIPVGNKFRLISWELYDRTALPEED